MPIGLSPSIISRPSWAFNHLLSRICLHYLIEVKSTYYPKYKRFDEQHLIFHFFCITLSSVLRSVFQKFFDFGRDTFECSHYNLYLIIRTYWNSQKSLSDFVIDLQEYVWFYMIPYYREPCTSLLKISCIDYGKDLRIWRLLFRWLEISFIVNLNFLIPIILSIKYFEELSLSVIYFMILFFSIFAVISRKLKRSMN